MKALFALLAAAVLAPGARAANLTTLYSFCSQPQCADGGFPAAALVVDAKGNFYGTTTAGGISNGMPGRGTVFRVTPAGTLTTLHVFAPGNSRDGAQPASRLVIDPAGNLLSTTGLGGLTGSLSDAGVAFALRPADGSERVLYDFCSDPHCADGYRPNGLSAAGGGTYFGTTRLAQSDSTGGTLFALRQTGPGQTPQVATLYSFPYPLHPSSGLARDPAGQLYGTIGDTRTAGQTRGLIYAVDPAHPTPRTLYEFCLHPGCPDGDDPRGVTVAADGSLYGTTAMGGSGPYGQGGTLYHLTREARGRKWDFTLVHSFCQQPQCADGAAADGLSIDAAGNIYGTAEAAAAGAGLLFRIGTDGTYTILYTFCKETNCADGSVPHGPLVQDRAGNFYGVAGGGGAENSGTVFKLTP